MNDSVVNSGYSAFIAAKKKKKKEITRLMMVKPTRGMKYPNKSIWENILPFDFA